MLSGSLETIKRERAKFARDVEYLKEMAIDDVIDDRTEIAESLINKETIEELKEAADMVQKLSGEVNMVAANAEIDMIMNAESNITFDEMIGIEE